MYICVWLCLVGVMVLSICAVSMHVSGTSSWCVGYLLLYCMSTLVWCKFYWCVVISAFAVCISVSGVYFIEDLLCHPVLCLYTCLVIFYWYDGYIRLCCVYTNVWCMFLCCYTILCYMHEHVWCMFCWYIVLSFCAVCNRSLDSWSKYIYQIWCFVYICVLYFYIEMLFLIIYKFHFISYL